MRVLMTADVVGGVWTYAVDLARALRPRGVEVVVAALGGPLSPERWREASRVFAEVHARPYRLIWMRDPWDGVRASRRWIAQLARRVSPDVYHANDHGVADAPVGVPTLAVGHSCVLSWWRAVRGEPAPPRWGRYRHAVARALSRADLVVAPTAAMLRSLELHYGPLPSARVVHNGVDPDRFRGTEEAPCILTCGRLWDDAKDVATLARAARDVPWPVLAVGADRHPDGGRVSLRGIHALGSLPREAAAACLGRAAIYAHPARYEPFGLAPLEAALAGCALVLADVPTLRELWNGCARFFPPGDERALAAALRDLCASRSARLSAAAAARRRALSLTLDRAADTYAALYRELAGGRRAPLSSPAPLARSRR